MVLTIGVVAWLVLSGVVGETDRTEEGYQSFLCPLCVVEYYNRINEIEIEF